MRIELHTANTASKTTPIAFTNVKNIHDYQKAYSETVKIVNNNMNPTTVQEKMAHIGFTKIHHNEETINQARYYYFMITDNNETFSQYIPVHTNHQKIIDSSMVPSNDYWETYPYKTMRVTLATSRDFKNKYEIMVSDWDDSHYIKTFDTLNQAQEIYNYIKKRNINLRLIIKKLKFKNC